MITALNSARISILQAYHTHYRSPSYFADLVEFRGCGDLLDSQLHQWGEGFVQRAVQRQSKLLKAWLLWSYAPGDCWNDEGNRSSVKEQAVQAVWLAALAGGVDFDERMKAMKEPRKIRTQYLIYLHMMNYRSLAFSGHYKYRKPKDIAAGLSRMTGGTVRLNMTNYHKEYGWIHDAVHNACSYLDGRSLGPVAEELRLLRQWYGKTPDDGASQWHPDSTVDKQLVAALQASLRKPKAMLKTAA